MITSKSKLFTPYKNQFIQEEKLCPNATTVSTSDPPKTNAVIAATSAQQIATAESRSIVLTESAAAETANITALRKKDASIRVCATILGIPALPTITSRLDQNSKKQTARSSLAVCYHFAVFPGRHTVVFFEKCVKSRLGGKAHRLADLR